jgi:hypothetical protein
VQYCRKTYTVYFGLVKINTINRRENEILEIIARDYNKSAEFMRKYSEASSLYRTSLQRRFVRNNEAILNSQLRGLRAN